MNIKNIFEQTLQERVPHSPQQRRPDDESRPVFVYKPLREQILLYTMNKEIERKFLVCGDYKSQAYSSSRIIQGYICHLPGRTVRVRIRDNQGFLTIKNAPKPGEIGRNEWEWEIPLEDAKGLISLCERGLIDKTRFLVRAGDHVFEVDEFYGDNEGLTIAEVELSSEDEVFEKPSWLGEEVTGDRRYYNSMLLINPFKNW